MQKNVKNYPVLKDHSGYKKGDVRTMHPNLAKILAKQGLVSMKDAEDVDAPIEPASVTVDQKGKVEQKPAKSEKPKSGDDKDKPEVKKSLVDKLKDKVGLGEDDKDKSEDDPKIADDIKQALDN